MTATSKFSSSKVNACDTSLDEFRALFPILPEPHRDYIERAQAHQQDLTKPAGSLGRLEEIAIWLAGWQGRDAPRIEMTRIAIFAGSHGVASAHPVSAFPVEVTAQMVANFHTGGAAINQICKIAESELQIYDMNVETPTADFSTGPAMSEADCVVALAMGMTSASEGLDALAIGEMGIGATTSASALCCALFGGDPEDWCGPGTGVDADGIKLKAHLIAEGLKVNAAALKDPLSCLAAFGGREIAAITGAILAARMARIPVILDGFIVSAAAAVLHKADPTALDHCLIAHNSAEPAHKKLLEHLGKTPLLDFNMRLGEGSGAGLVIPLLRTACAIHNGMATFSGAGVDTKTS